MKGITNAITPLIDKFTNLKLGTIKGSTTKYQISANTDGTGTVNGLSTLESDVMQNTDDIANLVTTIANKATILKPTSRAEIISMAEVGDILLIDSSQFAGLTGLFYVRSKTATEIGLIVILAQVGVERYTVNSVSNIMSSANSVTTRYFATYGTTSSTSVSSYFETYFRYYLIRP